jgi:hypothetical protein
LQIRRRNGIVADSKVKILAADSPARSCKPYPPFHNPYSTFLLCLQIRRRNGIVADSKVKILAAESDLYVAEIGGTVTVKMGARYDMGGLVPKEADGWKVATWGKDFCVSAIV